MLGFEESYVLTSADGLAYTSTTPIAHALSEDEVIARARREREEQRKNASLKSLRDQLRENAEKADAEWKEKHNPFMAPKGLDSEDLDWLSEEEAKKAQRDRLRRMQEDTDRVSFELAVARRKEEEAKANAGAASATSVVLPVPQPSFSFREVAESRTAAPQPSASLSALMHTAAAPSSLPLDRLSVVRVKRKDGAHRHAGSSPSSAKRAKPDSAVPSPPPLPVAAPQSTSPPSTKTAEGLRSLLQYADNDDDD